MEWREDRPEIAGGGQASVPWMKLSLINQCQRRHQGFQRAIGPTFQGVLEKWWPLSVRVCGHTSFLNAVLQAVIINFKWTHMHMHHLDSSSRILAYINTVCHTPFKISCFSYLWQQLISSRQRMQIVHKEVNLSTKYLRAALFPTFYFIVFHS